MTTTTHAAQQAASQSNGRTPGCGPVAGSRFRRGQRSQLRLRMMIDGPAKSGKSFSALRCAYAMAGPAGRVAVIEAGERGATEKYYGTEIDGRRWEFDITQLDTYSPDAYTAAVQDAGREGYDCIVIDSLSHEWIGKDGTLAIADQAGAQARNNFAGWRVATPLHDKLFETILASPAHVIACVRSKMDYVLQTNDKGKQEPVKVGMAPVQRPGVEYEFDVLLSLDPTHTGTITGSRCPAVDGAVFHKPGPNLIDPIREWLETGVRVAMPLPSPRINDQQVERVAELLAGLGWTLDRIAREFPRKFGCRELSQLSREQADAVIKWLEAQATAKRPSQSQPSGGNNATPPAAHEAAGAAANAPAANGDRITEEQADELRAMVRDRGVDPKAFLAQFGLKATIQMHATQYAEAKAWLSNSAPAKAATQEAEATVASAQPVAPVGDMPPPKPGIDPALANKPLTDSQQADLLELKGKLDAWGLTREQWRGFLNEFALVSTARALTVAQAAGLIAKLRTLTPTDLLTAYFGGDAEKGGETAATADTKSTAPANA